MGGAEDLVNDLIARPLSPEQIEQRKGERIKLRLRPDIPTVEVDSTTRVHDVLGRLESGNAGSLALRDSRAGVAAMVVPVERYLELVSAELAADPTTAGVRVHPELDMALAALHVEPAGSNDPSAQAGTSH